MVLLVVGWGSASYADGFLYVPLESLQIACDFCGYQWADGTCHRALDLKARTSIPVLAAANGNVIRVEGGLDNTHVGIQRFNSSTAYGNHIRLRHPNGYTSIYAHLAKGSLRVSETDSVIAGQVLGSTDNSGWSTGPHLHFEVRDPHGNKVDPYGRDASADVTGCLATAPANPSCGPNALWKTCPPTPYRADAGVTMDAGVSDAGMQQHDAGITCRENEPCNTHLLGPCAAGKTKCVNNQQTCEQVVFPSEELCNGIDDDCNGVIDDPWRDAGVRTIGAACTVGVGECQNTGVMVCAPDGRATMCNADPKPPEEELCDGKDNNCDGEIDEPWKGRGPVSLGEPCTVGVGTCAREGEWQCAPDGRAVVCSADVSRWPNCQGKVCGSDGCGGSCGICNDIPAAHCSDAHTARSYTAQCTALGICNYTPIDTVCQYSCENGACTTCTPNCQNRQCGPDGCGGSCGACQPAQLCDGTHGQCYTVSPQAWRRCETVNCELGETIEIGGEGLTRNAQAEVHIVKPGNAGEYPVIVAATADQGAIRYDFHTSLQNPAGEYKIFVKDITSGSVSAQVSLVLKIPPERISVTRINDPFPLSIGLPRPFFYDSTGTLHTLYFGTYVTVTSSGVQQFVQLNEILGNAGWPSSLFSIDMAADGQGTPHFCVGMGDNTGRRELQYITKALNGQWQRETVSTDIAVQGLCRITIGAGNKPMMAFVRDGQVLVDGGVVSTQTIGYAERNNAWRNETINDPQCPMSYTTSAVHGADIKDLGIWVDTYNAPVVVYFCIVKPSTESSQWRYLQAAIFANGQWGINTITSRSTKLDVWLGGFIPPLEPTHRRFVGGSISYCYHDPSESCGSEVFTTDMSVPPATVWPAPGPGVSCPSCKISQVQMFPEPDGRVHVFFRWFQDRLTGIPKDALEYLWWNGVESVVTEIGGGYNSMIGGRRSPYEVILLGDCTSSGRVCLETLRVSPRDGIDSNGDGRDEP